MATFEPVDFDPFKQPFKQAEKHTILPAIDVLPDGPPPPPPPPANAPAGDPQWKGPSAEDATWQNYVSGTAGGFNKGLGLPVDLMNALIGMTGLPTNEAPFLGSKWFEKMGMAPPPPDTVGGRALERIGQEFGGAVLPSGALMKVAGKFAAPATAKIAPTMRPGSIVRDRILAPMAAKPGTSLGLESVATAGSGSAAAAARETFPNSPTFEQIAQIAGGFAPGLYAKVAPTMLAIKGANKFRQTFSKDAQAKQGQQIVKNMLGRELTPEVMPSLREADRLATEIPGFKPSIAEATGSPGLIAQQKAIEGKASGSNLDQLVARRRANEAAVADYTASAAPAAENNPEFVVNTAKGRIDTLRTNIGTQQANVQGQRQQLADTSFPRVDRAEQGGVIRNQLHEERAARRQAADDLSQSLGLDNIDATANFTAFAQRARQNFTPNSPFDDAANRPDVLRTIARVGRPVPQVDAAGNPILDAQGNAVMGPRRVTFQDLKGLRERVSDDLIDAAGSANPSRKLVRDLTRLRGHVDELIDNMGETIGPRYAQFRRAYFEDYIQPFEQGAAYKVRSLDGRGFYKTTDEKVADAFFKSGDTTSADQFNQIFANRPEARAALRSSVIDDMRASVVRDGAIDTQRFTAWVDKNRSVLQRFPEIAQELSTPARADAAYISRQRQLAGRQQSVEDNMLTKTVNNYSKGTFTAEAVIDKALGDPRKMEQLVGAVRRQEGALPALRRVVWDRAMNGDAAGITKFIVDNGKSLQHLFGREHLRDIQNIVSARMMIERVPHPTGAAYVPRPLEAVERVIGQGLPQLGNRIFALKSGRVQKEYLLIDMFLRSLRGRVQFAADDALRAALYDPKLARELANSLEAPSSHVVKATQIRSRLIDLGIPLLNKQDGGPEHEGE